MPNRTKNTTRQTEVVTQIRSCLGALKLRKMAELLEGELERLTANECTAGEALLRLFKAEVNDRAERRMDRRVQESKLPERKTLADFDFDFQPSLDKGQVLELMGMGFVARRQGVILAGNSGTGKSHIAKALAHEGCKHDYRVRYVTAARMLTTLYASLADNTLDDKLKLYLRPDLLVIDELGFDRLEQDDARNAALFFKVIDGRYAKKSTVLTTNIDFEQLGDYLGDPLVTTAVVDRMVHHSTVINIKGPSWRLEESKKLNANTRSSRRVAKDKQNGHRTQRPKTASSKNATPKKKSRTKDSRG